MNKGTDELIVKYTFPAAVFGVQQIPWNLAPLLFFGAAEEHTRGIIDKIINGEFGEPISDRFSLIDLLHEHLNHRVISGQSLLTTRSRIINLRKFISWCEKNSMIVSLSELQENFIAWSHYLLERVRVSEIEISTADSLISSLCPIFDDILKLESGLRKKVSIHHSAKSRKNKLTKNGTKQNLEEAYKFGSFLYDLTKGLSVDKIKGPLPLEIPIRGGGSLTEWCKLRPPESVKSLQLSSTRIARRHATINTRSAYIADTSLRTRHPLVNLRLEAELLIFIAETGLPLQSAYSIPYSKFSFKSITNGYEMKQIYKNRAQGEIVAQVHTEYRKVFDDYLSWRSEIFPNTENGLLFPFHSIKGKTEHLAPLFAAVKKRCSGLDIKMFGPRALKKTKVNFLLRETKAPNIAAEYGQHSLKTLFRNYHEPSHQIAMIEISEFHKKHDPFLAAAGPGNCIQARPAPVEIQYTNIPLADCLSPSGCLFCMQNRDVEGYDHIWSLLSFQYLKTIELSKVTSLTLDSDNHPAFYTIQRICDKINFLSSLSPKNEIWVTEARAKVTQGYYHPKWDGFIRLQRHEK